MFCVNCGAKAETGEKFCRNCGKPVKTAGEITAEITEAFRMKQMEGVPEKIRAIEQEAGPDFINKLKGDHAFTKGNYRDAYDHYEKISKKSRPWDVFFNMSLIDLSSGRPKDAIENLKKITSMDIDLAQSLIYSGRYRDRQGLFAEIYLYLGVLYRNINEQENAVKAFEKAIQYDPQNELAYANLGEIMMKGDNYDGAIASYKKAVENSTDTMKRSHLNNDLGLAYFRKGLIEEAIASFKDAILLNSDNKNAVYNLGLIYVRSGMQDKVKDDYKEFLKHESGVDIVFNLSRSIMDVAKQELLSGINVDFIGNDESVKKVKDIIMKAAATDSTVFIQGDNGTGKELAARAIHQLSKRSDKPLIVVNCGALPETLLESELFGYEKGAFTGAHREKPGRFELADKGTIFLDEIGDITQAMQVKLLRFVQSREFERVGGIKTLKVDVRIITATNRDIKKMVEEGRFREDLYYRLYVLPIIMPPLRERGRDIMALAEYFLRKFSDRNSKDFSFFSNEAMNAFYTYHWPGNVRQLENVIERIVTLYDGPEVKLEYLPAEIIPAAAAAQVKEAPAAAGNREKEAVMNALEASKYSKTKTAKALGISRVALWKRMKKMGIE